MVKSESSDKEKFEEWEKILLAYFGKAAHSVRSIHSQVSLSLSLFHFLLSPFTLLHLAYHVEGRRL
jgi:hypothetical protein